MLLITLTMCTSVFATERKQTINIPADLKKTTISATRTGNYSYVTARCYSVYPTSGGVDTFSKIRCEITDSSGNRINSNQDGKTYFTLPETHTSATKIGIQEGKLGNKSIKFAFYGNSVYAARAEVGYDPK